MFNIIDYIRKVDCTSIRKMINRWEEDRGALEYETIFDLTEKEDFIFFVKKYGISKAIYYYNRGIFYYDGMNYSVPIKTTLEDMIKFVRSEIDIRYFKNCLKNFGTIDHWQDLVDVNKIKQLIEKEEKQDYKAEVLLYGNKEEINSIVTALRCSDVVKGLKIQRV